MGMKKTCRRDDSGMKVMSYVTNGTTQLCHLACLPQQVHQVKFVYVYSLKGAFFLFKKKNKIHIRKEIPKNKGLDVSNFCRDTNVQ